MSRSLRVNGASSTRAVLRSLVVVLALVAAGSGRAQVAGGEDEMQAADLPVTRVVLFTNGIGYFEHEGSVTGDQVLDLDVAPEQMDDLLQSLVLQDFGGGRIEPVRYDSRDPLGRILAGYSIDLSTNPSLAEILAQARGERVTLTTSTTLSGVIVSVERVEAPEEPPRTFITLATDDGLRRLDLAEVVDVSFESAEVAAEIDAALAAIARHRASETTSVRLTFSGEGERRVRVGYVREMPVWKSSYRLVANDDGSAELQGWAILDNPTDLDLVDVSVAFVAGQPISFVTELFDPIYVERPHVAPQASAGPMPTADAGEFGAATARAMAPPPAFAPSAQFDMALESAAPQLSGAGVEAMATGSDGGATFAYRVNEPVSVGRHQSAMVPIVQQTVPAERLSLYDSRVLAGNPLAGLRLTNDTGLHLAAGTVTIYDANGFAGTALMADLVPGDSRVLTYAVDLEVAVDLTGNTRPEEVVAVSFVDGLLEQTFRQRLEHTVRLAPRTEEERLVVVDLPRSSGYEVVSPSPAPLLTPDSWRFGVLLNAATAADAAADGDVPVQLACEAGAESCELEVVLERVTSQLTAVGNLDAGRIAFFLENVELDQETRRLLDEILALKREVAQLASEIARHETGVTEIHQDQSRVRQNMGSLDRNSSLYRRYVADLEAQEGELDRIEAALADLRTRRDAAQSQLDDVIRGLRE